VSEDLGGIDKLPHPSTVEAIDLPSGSLDLWRPPRAETLLDAMIEGPHDPDEKLPYWADLWPSALGLAQAVDSGRLALPRPEEGTVVELGCGLGLVALVAARRGARVVATDWMEDALVYVRESAQLNGLTIETRRLDWRQPPDDLTPQLVLASDVLYEPRNAPWLAGLLDHWRRPGFCAVISDPGRAHARGLWEALDPTFWSRDVETLEVTGPLVPNGRSRVNLHHVRSITRRTRESPSF